MSIGHAISKIHIVNDRVIDTWGDATGIDIFSKEFDCAKKKSTHAIRMILSGKALPIFTMIFHGYTECCWEMLT